jgi:GNAT superfamily N-acetyltransferase
VPERDAVGQAGPMPDTNTAAATVLDGLRTVRDADGADLERLIRTCWDAYAGCVLDVDAEEPWLRAPATTLAAKGALAWVLPAEEAEIGHRLAASVALHPAPDRGVGELKTLYVWPGARRGGLGAALVGHAEAVARARGDRRMVLWSDTRFAEAHRLYERLGYERGPTRELHDLSNSVEHFFARDL